MEKKTKVEDQVEDVCLPILQEAGYDLYDIEYVKEGPDWFLRIYIDRDGVIDLDDCEKISRLLDAPLDGLDPIGHGYYLEVSSPGVERNLRKPAHFTSVIGEKVAVKLFYPWNGRKELLGNLEAVQEDGIRLLLPDIADKPVFFPYQSIAKANLSVF